MLPGRRRDEGGRRCGGARPGPRVSLRSAAGGGARAAAQGWASEGAVLRRRATPHRSDACLTSPQALAALPTAADAAQREVNAWARRAARRISGEAGPVPAGGFTLSRAAPPARRSAPARRRASPLRSAPFAAIIPGDSAPELVITTCVHLFRRPAARPRPPRVTCAPPGLAPDAPRALCALARSRSGINSFLNIYNTLLVGRLILTWFPSPPQAIAGPLSTLCDPYLNLFRGIIPPLGGTLDFSPILAFLTLNVFQNTAAALPAELAGRAGIAEALPASDGRAYLTVSPKWQQRLAATRAAKQTDE